MSTPPDFKIIPPDFSLRDKIIGNTLNNLFSPQAMAAAQSSIAETAPYLIQECVAHGEELRVAVKEYITEPNADKRKKLADIGFAIKEKASLADYQLVAAMSDSLTSLMETNLTTLSRPVIEWHVQGILDLLAAKVSGDGGATGTAIRAELSKIAEKNVKQPG